MVKTKTLYSCAKAVPLFSHRQKSSFLMTGLKLSVTHAVLAFFVELYVYKGILFSYVIIFSWFSTGTCIWGSLVCDRIPCNRSR